MVMLVVWQGEGQGWSTNKPRRRCPAPPRCTPSPSSPALPAPLHFAASTTPPRDPPPPPPARVRNLPSPRQVLNYGTHGVARDHGAALQYFKLAAAAGDVGAMAHLGHM